MKASTLGCLIGVCAALLACGAARAQDRDSRLFSDLRWRMVGPFRGGRTVAAAGVPGHPGLFYIGVNDGGVWKTDDFGRTWSPLFDAESTGSVGALAIAPSDPRVIYVGSGEGLQRPDLSVGDGVYKSTDGGATWKHLGLRDGQQIPALVVDPRDPRRVFAAVLGHPYGPNDQRGVFRSLDGGATWTRVLYHDEDTGAMDVALDPADPKTVYADLWSARQAPWEAGFDLHRNNGFWKSVDGGSTWKRAGEGLPDSTQGLGRIGIATCASEPARLFAIVGATKGGGLYRSDDRGEHWKIVNTDARLWGRDGDFNEVRSDPKNADVLYVANVVTWKSTDGGRTFRAWRGAPGGDDYHRVWVSPDDSRTILLASDQGAIVTVNGGSTWSSWYNQPTAQMFHVNVDDRFPYWIYGGQQESGSVGIASRGNDGQITFREWHPVGAEEYGYAVPDPRHPNLVFGGKISRFDWTTGQVKDVSPVPRRSTDVRFVRTAPIAFSPADPRVLYFAGNVVFRTSDGGEHWRTISGDLTREASAWPASVGRFAPHDPEQGKHRGVVYALAPSPRRAPLLWAGTDDGLLWVTHDDGAKWSNVTPASLTPWSKVSVIEASHHDTLEAYAAINRFRLDDLRPHVLRTRDGGRTWTEIVRGLPENEVVNVVREDPVRRGLLFAGTERSVYVSFDDGDRWQSLRLNLPPCSMRDLAIHGSDLVVATHGRSFWVLDDYAPLREIAEAAAAKQPFLFTPAPATRVRWNLNTDTPLPPDEPAGHNPLDGAPIDYLLPARAAGLVTLEILDGSGAVVRRYTSRDTFPADHDLNIPDYWIRPSRALATEAGMHRWVWDLCGEAPPAERGSYPISAIAGETWREPRGPRVTPGEYRVRLTAGSTVVTRPLHVAMDPRVVVGAEPLARQAALAKRVCDGLRDAAALTRTLERARETVRARIGQAPHGALSDSLGALDARLSALAGEGGGPRAAGLRRLQAELGQWLEAIEGVDDAPTSALADAATGTLGDLARMRSQWDELRRRAASDLDSRLRAAHLAPLALP